MQWHYTKRGQQFGPVDDAELRRLAQQGEITPSDFVWNPTLGDKWSPASTVETLFASLPRPVVKSEQPPTASRGGGATHNRDLMRMARESLRTHWGLGVGVMVLYWVISVGVSYIPFAGMIAGLLLAGPLMVGLCLVFLKLTRQSAAKVGQLFHGFQRFGTALGAYLLTTLFIMLWCLLLIIPGIIASYSYAMTFYVIADDPTVGPLQAITKSKEIMSGNKWKLFCLSWRFFGWSLLCILTLGIGFLWLTPYLQTTMAHFYNDVRR
jgi:uncharacterized membrane protein